MRPGKKRVAACVSSSVGSSKRRAGARRGGITIETVGELETKDATRHRLKWYTGLALMSELGVARLNGVLA